MNEKHQITMINCYIGNFPWYFNFFIKSCELNHRICFLVFSNAKFHGKLPKNLKIIPFSLDTFNLISSDKLGFKVNVIDPYKLTDFKPAFGLIFSNYLTESKFWGFCDLDIIFGRIMEFFTDEQLHHYDIFSARKDYPTGYFMLFKNKKNINNLFKKSRDYQKVFQSNIHYCFDECNFKHDYLMKGTNIFKLTCDIESMHHIIMKESELGSLKISFKMRAVEGIPGDLSWKNGLLTYKTDYEVLLYHLIDYKKNLFTKPYNGINIPNSFSIGKYNFKNNETMNFVNILKYNYFEKFRPAVKRILHKIDFATSFLFINKLNIPNIIGEYRFWDHTAYISKNKSSELKFTCKNVVKTGIIFRSLLNNKTFFILGNPNVELKIEINKKGLINNFLWVENNGNTQKFCVVN